MVSSTLVYIISRIPHIPRYVFSLLLRHSAAAVQVWTLDKMTTLTIFLKGHLLPIDTGVESRLLSATVTNIKVYFNLNLDLDEVIKLLNSLPKHTLFRSLHAVCYSDVLYPLATERLSTMIVLNDYMGERGELVARFPPMLAAHIEDTFCPKLRSRHVAAFRTLVVYTGLLLLIVGVVAVILLSWLQRLLSTLAPSPNSQSHPPSIPSSPPPASSAPITAPASSSGLYPLARPTPPSFSRMDLETKDQDRLARDFIIDDDVQSSVQAATGRAPTVDEGDDRSEAIQVGHLDVKNQEAEATKVKQQDIPLPTLPQRYIIGNNKAHSGLFPIFINGIIKILNANIAPTQEDGPDFSDSNHPATPKKVLVDISIQTDHPTSAPSPSALGKRPIANILDFMERAVPEQSQPPSDKDLHVMALAERMPNVVHIEEMDDQTVGAGSKSVPVEQAHSQEKVVEVKDLVADANMFMNYSGKYVGPSLTSDARFPAGRQTEEQRGTEIPQRVVLDKSETVDILGIDHVTGPIEEPSMTRTSMGSAETLTVSASDAVVYSDTAPQLKSDEDYVAVGGLAETMDVLVGNSVVPTSTSEANPSVIGETEVQDNFEMASEVDLEQAHTQEQVVAIEDLVAATNMFMNCSRSSEIGIAPERYEPTPEETAVKGQYLIGSIQNMWATMNMCMNRSGSSSVDPSLPAGRETEEQSGVDEPVPEQAEAEPTTGDGKKKKKKKKKKAAVSNGEPGMDIPDNGEPHTLLQDVVAEIVIFEDTLGAKSKGQMHGMFAKGITAPSEIVCTGCYYYSRPEVHDDSDSHCSLNNMQSSALRIPVVPVLTSFLDSVPTSLHLISSDDIDSLKRYNSTASDQIICHPVLIPLWFPDAALWDLLRIPQRTDKYSLYITNINAPGSTYPTYIQHTKIFGLERLQIITSLFWY
ncbi:hypothetical protein BU17DRAFT_69788 [Hysterangium stoloniferum]|nr:hypothetical protein BU17DRAFT_69788 [Hysterangium stoloniferum]